MGSWSNRLSGALILTASYALAGCGVQVPTLEPLASSQLEVGQVVTKIANQIGCEIGIAVSKIHTRYKSPELAREIAWLDNWAAKVTLTITVEEKTILAPGISLKTLFPTASTFSGAGAVASQQFFSFGIGGQFSTGATRTETVGYFVSLGALRRRVEKGRELNKDCPTGVGPNDRRRPEIRRMARGYDCALGDTGHADGCVIAIGASFA